MLMRGFMPIPPATKTIFRRVCFFFFFFFPGELVFYFLYANVEGKEEEKKKRGGGGNRRRRRRTNRRNDARGWPDKAAADAHAKLRGEDQGGGLPEPLGDDVVRGLLHSELEVGTQEGVSCGCVCGGGGGRVLVGGGSRSVVSKLQEGLGRRRGDGEATGLVDAGDVDVEPLAGKELICVQEGVSLSVLRCHGAGGNNRINLP